MCIALYDTAYRDCLKWGENIFLCPLQECTMNYSYSMYRACQCTVTLVVYGFYRWAISNLQVINSPGVKAINHECDRTLSILYIVYE